MFQVGQAQLEDRYRAKNPLQTSLSPGRFQGVWVALKHGLGLSKGLRSGDVGLRSRAHALRTTRGFLKKGFTHVWWNH